ncbi:MAG: tetratricopeptide repeat protein [Candidatus Kapabacteria bacterium]|nr:tetratricopeptide repeat protein [Candidatus Kapabacteria bacterium]
MIKSCRQILTAAIIAKDNEKTIANMINSLKLYCGRIVVVDTGSSDKTTVIAASLGADVYFKLWDDDFSSARNFALAHVFSDWILTIDTDEILSKFDVGEFLDYANDPQIGGINVIIKNMLGDGLESKHRYTRIFRNKNYIRFEGKIHEQINQSIVNNDLQIIESNIEITHYGYEKNDKIKNDRNIKLLQNELDENPQDDFARYHLAQSLFNAKDIEKADKIFREIRFSNDLSRQQKDTIQLRLAQIALDTNNFDEVLNLCAEISDDYDIGGLQLFVKAMAFYFIGDYSHFSSIVKDSRIDLSALVSKENLETLREISIKIRH